MSHDEIPAGMSPPLSAAYHAIRELLAHAGRSEVRARHEIGTIIGDIKRSKRKYGTQAVQRLARALGSDEQTLYRCASVAECWSKQQVDALLSRTTPYGQPLTWSHFVVLASVAPDKRRTELFERCVRDALSVRALMALAADELRVAADDGESGGPALDRLVRTTERLARQIETIHTDIISTLPRRERRAQRHLIEQAIAANERLQEVVRQQAERLMTQHEKLRKETEHPRPLPRLLAGG